MPAPERPLRIALYTYATQPRGGVVHVLELGRALHERGHAVVLHALDASGRGFFRPTPCATRIIPVEPLPRATTLAMVRSRIASYVAALASGDDHFDVYHAHDGISGNALAILTACGVIPGFVRTVHHLDDFADRELASLQARSVAAAQSCFVVSERWRTRLRECFRRAAVVVPSGVDAVRLAPPTDDVRRALRRSFGFGEGPVFATIGGIESRKNSLAILEAFARVRVDLPQARLVIAGGASVLDHGSYRAAFDARVAELGLGDAIRLLGVLDDDGLARVLHAADAFVFPSLVEGFGLVVLEALAAGLPVVTSAIAPFTEYLGAADAHFARPDEPASIAAAMLRASDAGARERARSAGPAFAARFTWDASARAHLPVYRAAARARGRSLLPEMHFIVRWPDDTRTTCYSPSLVVSEHLAPATSYPLPEFLARVRVALRIASERVEAKYGTPCVRAIDQLAAIEATAATFAGEPPPTVTVESFAA